MPGYVIADVEVLDPERYAEYRALVPASLEPFDGRFLVRGGPWEHLEGDWAPHRVVVLEFPTVDHARRWYESELYGAAKEIRLSASRGNLILVEGA